jgi:hypothetical protein
MSERAIEYDERKVMLNMPWPGIFAIEINWARDSHGTRYGRPTSPTTRVLVRAFQNLREIRDSHQASVVASARP